MRNVALKEVRRLLNANHQNASVEKTAMRKFAMSLATAGVVGMLSFGTAFAADFDSKKFFDELSAKGVNTANLDSKKFFDELSSKGVNSTNRIDSKKFFDELSSKGVKMPANFDSKKFFDELSSKGVSAPPMVDTKK
jgi:hypothetical protein